MSQPTIRFELSIPFAELYRSYCDEDLTYICWILGNKLERKFISEHGRRKNSGSVRINEDVAMILYKKYREVVPNKFKWDITDDTYGHVVLMEEYGLTCMFHPLELNEMLSGAISICIEHLDDSLTDTEKFRSVYDESIRHSHMLNLREHILRVLTEKFPDGVLTVSADF